MEELLGIAILAYRSSRYWDAIELLMQIEERDPKNWLAKLYLGICYQRCGHLTTACRTFQALFEDCPDAHLAQQAKQALMLLENSKTKSSKAEPPTLAGRQRLLSDDFIDNLAV